MSAAALALMLSINGRSVRLEAHGFETAAATRLMQEVGTAAVPLAGKGRDGQHWLCRLRRLPGEPEAAELRCDEWLLRLVRPCSSDACQWLLVERRLDRPDVRRPPTSRTDR